MGKQTRADLEQRLNDTDATIAQLGGRIDQTHLALRTELDRQRRVNACALALLALAVALIGLAVVWP